MGCGISFVCSDVFFFFLVMFCDDVEMAEEEGSRWRCCLFSILVLLDRWWWLDRCWADECGFGGLLMAGSWWVLFGCLVCDDGGLWVAVFFYDGGLTSVGLLVRIGYDGFVECWDLVTARGDRSLL